MEQGGVLDELPIGVFGIAVVVREQQHADAAATGVVGEVRGVAGHCYGAERGHFYGVPVLAFDLHVRARGVPLRGVTGLVIFPDSSRIVLWGCVSGTGGSVDP